MSHDSELLPPRAATRNDVSTAPAPTARGRWSLQLASIRARLQISHLLTSLVPLLVLGTLLVYGSVQSERRTAEQVQLSVARSIASDVGNIMFGFSDDMHAFGERISRTEAREMWPPAADALLAEHAPMLKELAVLDAEGTELLRRASGNPAAALPLRQRSAELGVREAMGGHRHWGVVRSRYGRPLLQIAVPIVAGSATVNGADPGAADGSVAAPESVTGAVLAEFDTQLLAERLAAVPTVIGRSAFLVDENARTLIGQQPRALAGIEQLQVVWQEGSQVATLPAADGAIVLTRAPLDGFPWYVVVERPLQLRGAAVSGGNALLTIMLIGTAALVAVWTVVLSREITGPILRLRDAARAVGTGELAADVPVERGDEVGDLAREFNRMQLRLAESRAALEEQNRNLAAMRREAEHSSAELHDSLLLAGTVQRDLVTRALPAGAPVEAAAASELSAAVGGDFYSYIGLPDGRLRLAIGDATGTGVAAALVMVLTSSLLENHGRDAADPVELLERLNSILYRRFAHSGLSVGLLVADFDRRSARLVVANAGMIAPLVAGQGGQAYVECFGPPLGAIEYPRYEAVSVPLMPGQTAVFVSDGIVEARDVGREMWSFARLEPTVAAAADGGPQAIVDAVLGAVRGHTAAASAADDRTVIAIRLKAGDGMEGEGI